MSGPIIRKYGFPNFEKIFGERPLQHGIDADSETDESPKNEPPGSGPRNDRTKLDKKAPRKKNGAHDRS